MMLPNTPFFPAFIQAPKLNFWFFSKSPSSPKSKVLPSFMTGAGPNFPSGFQATSPVDLKRVGVPQTAFTSFPAPSFNGTCATKPFVGMSESKASGLANASQASNSFLAAPLRLLRSSVAAAISEGRAFQRGRSLASGTIKLGVLSFTLPSFGGWVVLRKKAASE